MVNECPATVRNRRLIAIGAEKIGMETTTYVRNIYKYYAAYKLVEQARANAAKLKEQVAPAK